MATARFYITTVASAKESGTSVPPHIAFDALTNFSPTFSQRNSAFPLSNNTSASDHTVRNNTIFNVTGYVSTQPLTSFDNNLVDYTNLAQRPQTAYNILKKWFGDKTELYIYSEYDVYSPLLITQFIPLNEGQDAVKLDITLEEVKYVGYSKVDLVKNVDTEVAKEATPSTSNGGTGKENVTNKDHFDYWLGVATGVNE